jgi:hypothetical protein
MTHHALVINCYKDSLHNTIGLVYRVGMVAVHTYVGSGAPALAATTMESKMPIGIVDVLITKAARTESFNWEELPESSRAYAADYGLRQCIIDTVAGIARKDFNSDDEFHAAAWKVAEKRVNQLRSGDVPKARVASDPATIAARKLADALKGESVNLDELKAWLASRKTPTGDSTTTVAPDSTLKPKKSKAA